MKEFLQSREDEMLSLLEELVNIDSGSANKEGIDQIGARLSAVYRENGFLVEVIEEKEQGNHLLIQHKDAVNPKIIAVAHMDTVFKKGTAKERPFKIEGNRAFGPGVIDMKASQVALLYGLKALIRGGYKGFKNVQIVLNSDEEIGSPTSRTLIEDQAEGKSYALIMEPARKNGALVSARRGGGRYSLYVTGKAAHSGIEPENGISAIEELAHKTLKLHALTDHDQGISVSVGLIEGGESVNTIAPSAVGHVDVRISKMEQAEEIDRKVREICNTADIPGTSIHLEGGVNRPPMVKNTQTIELLKVIEAVGEQVGVEVKDVATGGGSDASFTSAKGIPTVDGLGPVGGNAHSDEEYLEVPTLVERTHMLAELIRRLSE